MLIAHDDSSFCCLSTYHDGVAAHHYKDDRLMRKSTEPTENICPRFDRLGAQIAITQHIKIARFETRIIEPACDQHRALPRGRRRPDRRYLSSGSPEASLGAALHGELLGSEYRHSTSAGSRSPGPD